MKILLTLDYELFLGDKTGTVDKCLVQPMKLLLQQIEGLDVKFTIFVDAAYLFRLKELSVNNPSLSADYNILKVELKDLVNMGHDIQLHIHPQWYYSSFGRNQWTLDQKHYKLTDIPKLQMDVWFKKSKDLLDEIVGYKTKAFRAGGFSAQPFKDIKPFFETNSILMDSSACPGTSYNSCHQKYDYTKCPFKSLYTFEEDIVSEQKDGRFTEVPITMYPVSPFFYWHLVLTRLLKNKKHVKLGDGETVRTVSGSIIERLTKSGLSLSTIDGLKISYLYNSLVRAKKRGNTIFCVIGHPKLATTYSIQEFGRFCRKAISMGYEFTTISKL